MSSTDPAYQSAGCTTSGISNEATDMLQTFWVRTMDGIKKMTQVRITKKIFSI